MNKKTASISRRRVACLVAGVMLILGANAPAVVWTNIFLDDFQSVSAGTGMQPTNYLVNLNGYTSFVMVTNYSGGAGPAVVTNAFGSNRLLMNAAAGNEVVYEVHPMPSSTNVGLRILFDLVVNSTNSNLAGGFNVSINSNGVADASEALIRFSDLGGIIFFTNTPGPTTYVPIGTFVYGTTNSYQVDLNLFLDTFSVAQNGVALTNNVPLPGYLNNVFLSQVSFAADETTGAGNSFLLDNVIVQIPEPTAVTVLVAGLVLGSFLRRRK